MLPHGSWFVGPASGERHLIESDGGISGGREESWKQLLRHEERGATEKERPALTRSDSLPAQSMSGEWLASLANWDGN